MEKEGSQAPSYLIISSTVGPSVQVTQVTKQEPFHLQACPFRPQSEAISGPEVPAQSTSRGVTGHPLSQCCSKGTKKSEGQKIH